MGCPKADTADTEQAEIAFPVKSGKGRTLRVCTNGLFTWRTLIRWIQIYKMESKQKASKELHFFSSFRTKCLQVEQMHVLVAPVCSRFSHPKKGGCLSGRTICKPSVQAFTRGKLLFVCLFHAQKLSKLASWRNLSSLALHLMETCLVFPLFSLAEHFLAAEPKGTCLFWNLYLPGLFFF